VALTLEQERLYLEDLEKRGESQVRSELEHGKISPGFVHLTSTWLAGKEREVAAKKLALETQQMRLLERSATATEKQASEAQRANTRATWALALSIISLLVTIIAALGGVFGNIVNLLK
jgi:hypothetical protein